MLSRNTMGRQVTGLIAWDGKNQRRICMQIQEPGAGLSRGTLDPQPLKKDVEEKPEGFRGRGNSREADWKEV